MRPFEVFALIAAFVTYVSALPPFGFGSERRCLTKSDAYDLVNNFIQLSNGNEFNVTLAKDLLTKDVVDTSGSVASIINGGMSPFSLRLTTPEANFWLYWTGEAGPVPLLGPTLGNRSDFIAANSAQASTPYQPLNIYWTCDVVTFRFVIDFKPQPVLGITILETVPAPRDCQFPFKIKQVCYCSVLNAPRAKDGSIDVFQIYGELGVDHSMEWLHGKIVDLLV